MYVHTRGLLAVLARCFRRSSACVAIILFCALDFDFVLACLPRREQDFLNANAQFDVGPTGSKVLQNCLAYKLCYYRFGELRVSQTTRMCASGARSL